MREFLVLRVKSLKTYTATRPGQGLISETLKIRDSKKHLVVVVLGMLDEDKDLEDAWIARALTAAKDGWDAKEQL